MTKINLIADRLVGVLPKRLQPAAKAIVPGATALAGVAINYAASGEAPTPGVLEAGLYTIGLGLLVYLLPNRAQ